MLWYEDLTWRRTSSGVTFSGGPPWETVCGEMLSGFHMTRGEEGSASLRSGTVFRLNSLLRTGGGFVGFIVLLLLVVVGFMALPMKRRPPR